MANWPVPVPGEVHPAYAEQAWWLKVNCLVEDPPMRQAAIPIWLTEPSWLTEEGSVGIAAMPAPYVLDLYRCGGSAPYVGDPFYYEWRAAIDRLGRAVAGEAYAVYEPVGSERWLVAHGYA